MPRWPQRSRKAPQRLAEPGAARPVGHGLARRRRAPARGRAARIARVMWVSRVPTVKTSTVRRTARRRSGGPSRSSASAYGAHRAGHVDAAARPGAAGCRGGARRSRPGSPIRRRLRRAGCGRRRRRRGATRGAGRYAGVAAAAGAGVANMAASAALLGRRSRAATSRWRSTSAARWPRPAIVARPSPSPPLPLGVGSGAGVTGAALLARRRRGQPVARVEPRLEDLVVARRGRRARRRGWPGRPQ